MEPAMIDGWIDFDDDVLFTSEILDIDFDNVFDETSLRLKSSASSVANIVVKTHEKKKRRRDRIIVLPLPRIVKSDMRRSIGIMVQNVYNSADYEFMFAFLTRTFHASTHFAIHVKGTPILCNMLPVALMVNIDIIGYTEPFLCLTNIADIAEHWFERMNDAPDLTFRFDDATIRVCSDNTSVFSGNFTVHGTRLEVNGRDVTQQRVLREHLVSSASQYKYEDDTVSRLLIANNSLRNVNYEHPQLTPYCMRGTINIRKDEQQFTRAVEFILDPPEKPEDREIFLRNLLQKLGMQSRS